MSDFRLPSMSTGMLRLGMEAAPAAGHASHPLASPSPQIPARVGSGRARSWWERRSRKASGRGTFAASHMHHNARCDAPLG